MDTNVKLKSDKEFKCKKTFTRYKGNVGHLIYALGFLLGVCFIHQLIEIWKNS